MNAALLKSLSAMAWRNLRRNSKRNLATGIAITAGFTAFLLAAGYAKRVDNVLSRYTIYGLRTGHITIVHEGSLEMYAIKPKQWSLTPDDQKHIEAAIASIAQVEQSGRILTGQGIVGNGCKSFPFMATGVDAHAEKYAMSHPELLKWAPHLGQGRLGTPMWEYSESQAPMAISMGLARLLGKSKVHDQIDATAPMSVIDCTAPDATAHFADDANIQLASGTWDGQMNAIDGEVVQQFNTGLMETNNASITLGVKHLQSLYNTENVSSYSIWLKNAGDIDKIVKDLRQRFKDHQPSPLEIIPWHDERTSPYYTGTMRFIVTMVSFIGAVLAMVIILSIFNSATMTVIERSEEVGMLRSLGYNRSRIRQIFVLEGFFLTFISTIAGIACGLVAMQLINNLNIRFTPPGVEGGMRLLIVPDVGIMLIATICVSSLGVIATWLAVAGISRKNIAELVAGTHR